MNMIEKIDLDRISFEEYTERSAELKDIGYMFIRAEGRVMVYALVKEPDPTRAEIVTKEHR